MEPLAQVRIPSSGFPKGNKSLKIVKIEYFTNLLEHIESNILKGFCEGGRREMKRDTLLPECRDDRENLLSL